MNILIPVSIYTVKFQVVEGRPYSLFERSVLEALASGYNTLDPLVELLQVNRSIVIQALITLMQAGWVALTFAGTAGYVVTAAGKEALKEVGRLPPNRLMPPPRTTKVLMERIWRNVCGSGDVSYLSDQDIKERMGKHPFARLPAQTSELPEPAEVRPLVRVDKLQSERILSIGPVMIWRHDKDWVRVSVNAARSQIIGLPFSWRKDVRLVQDILECASGDSDEDVTRYEQLAESLGECDEGGSEEGPTQVRRAGAATDIEEIEAIASSDATIVGKPKYSSISSTDTSRCAIALDEIEFMGDAAAHKEYLVRTLDSMSGPDNCIVIHTETLSDESVNDMARYLERALVQGLNIDILWGRQSREPKRHQLAIDRLSELERASFSAIPGRLMVDREPTGLPFNVVVCNSGGRFESVVGSHRWFASRVSGSTLSARITAPGVVASVCYNVVDLMRRSPHMATSSNWIRLQKATSDLEQLDGERAGQEFPIHGGVITGHRYVKTLLDWLCPSELSGPVRLQLIVPVWPDKLDDLVLNRLGVWLRGGNSAEILYGSEPRQTSFIRALSDLGVVLRRVSQLFANVATFGDRHAMIGSFGWLAKAERPGIESRRDFGVWLEGHDVARSIRSALRS